MKRLMFTLALLVILGPTSASLAQTTVTLNSTFGVDGVVTSGGSVLTIAEIFAGDTSVNTGVRGFVSFDIGSIPPGATIISATIRMYQETVNGTPYADLGNIMVDHIDYGATLDFADYNLPALKDNIGTISNNAALEFKTLDVTESLQDDMDQGRSRSQYRLLFPTQTDNDSVEDAAFFTPANRGDNSPKLIVIYQVSPVSPEEGTVGTEMSIAGSGFGIKKGKVLLETTPLKILEWTDSFIRCQLLKALPSGTYDLAIQPQARGSSPIVIASGFAVEAPEIDSVNPTSGSTGDEITVNGLFFGTKKGKVTLGGKTCRVLSWTMDPITGESEIQFVVPRGLSTGTKELKVTNGVGVDTTDFTVE